MVRLSITQHRVYSSADAGQGKDITMPPKRPTQPHGNEPETTNREDALPQLPALPMMAQFVKTPNRAMIRAVCSFLCDKMLDKAVDAHASCLCRCRQASRITPDPGPAGAILIGARSAFLPVAHRGLARSGLERRGRLTLLHRPAHVCLPTTRRSWQSTPQLVGDTRAPRAADARCRSE